VSSTHVVSICADAAAAAAASVSFPTFSILFEEFVHLPPTKTFVVS